MNKKSQERLDRLVASQTGMGRKEAKKAIYGGQVTIDGRVATQSDEKVNPTEQKVLVAGQTITYRKNIYLMMNKPPGVVSASDGKGVPTVVDLVPAEMFRQGLFPAGRLDKDTVGFVLITDDGQFAHNILSPRKHIDKTYEAIVNIPIGENEIRQFAEGITLSDAVLLPAELRVLGHDEAGTRVEIVLREGRYHQIKRMIGALGGEVLFLKRTKMGGLNLDPDLAQGACRYLTAEELEIISKNEKNG